jgi:hypothetical protein
VALSRILLLRRARLALLVAACGPMLLTACGSSRSTGTEPGIDAGAGGATGAAGEGGAAGESDFERLSECDAGACSRKSLAQLVEAYSHNIDREGLRCVLGALRDRTPGSLSHQTDSTFSNGSVSADHQLVVSADGSAVYAARRTSGGFTSSRIDDPAERCLLKPQSYFEACLTALELPPGDMDPEAWACAYGDGASPTSQTNLLWFEECVMESPATCP